MINLFHFIIIFILILSIYWIHTTYSNNTIIKSNNIIKSEHVQNFNYNKNKRLSIKKFMIRDLRTKLWLVIGLNDSRKNFVKERVNTGFTKFLPGRFGNPFILSENPNEYLPLKNANNPNDYLLSNYKGSGLRIETNPYTKYFIIQVFIYNGFNILGYIHENEQTKYIYIDDNGYITSVVKPEQASIIEIISL